VTSSVNPSVVRTGGDFHGEHHRGGPGSGTPTGTVQFKTNGVNFGGTVSLSGGSANSAAVSTLIAGSSTAVTAVYNGGQQFLTRAPTRRP